MEDTYSSSAEGLRSSESICKILRVCARLLDTGGGARDESLVGAKTLGVGQCTTTKVSTGSARNGARCIDVLETYCDSCGSWSH